MLGPVMQKLFGDNVTLTPQFTGEPVPKRKREVAQPEEVAKQRRLVPPKRVSSAPPAQQPAHNGNRRSFGRQARGVYKPFVSEHPIDISDKEVWRKTHMIMNHIPGTVKEIRG